MAVDTLSQVPRAASSASLIVGGACIHRVEESTYKLPISMFISDEAVLAGHRDWLLPRFMDADGNWDMLVQSWIAVIDDKVVVIDPCVGNARPLPDFPMFHMLETPFLDRFEATGFRPEDVTHVFCTHLHSDHCGWNTRLREGRYVPTFPNARYVIVRREFDRWNPDRPGFDPSEPHNRLNAGIFENSVRPVVAAGLVDLVADTHRISEGLLVEPAHGHTIGHSVLTLTSGDHEACFTGDVFHHPLELLYPEIHAETCEYYPDTIDSRKRLIARSIDRGVLFIPGHFAAPHAGFVRMIDGVAVFQPYGD